MFTYTALSGKITFFSEETHQDGDLILRGKYQFTSVPASKGKPAQKDEVAFKCKGRPAEEIKASGMHSTGVAEGYVDIKIEIRTVKDVTFKDKVPTFVIRNWCASSSNLFSPTVFDEEIIVDEDSEIAEDNEASEIAQNSDTLVNEEEEFDGAYNPEQAPRPAVSFSF
ncbi:hypothetical protein NIES2101_23320 [Calothrix sp. HK-06]|nr:hypothetical protein NIES2101_23320 [Calothrix sp. HK-06]